MKPKDEIQNSKNQNPKMTIFMSKTTRPTNKLLAKCTPSHNINPNNSNH